MLRPSALILGWLLAAGLEALAVWAVAVGDMGTAALVHGLSAAMAGITARWAPPASYRQGLFTTPLLVCGMCLFLPVLGLVLVSGLGALLYFPKPRRAQRWQRTPIPELPVQPVMVSGRISYGEGGLVEVLRHADADEKRLNAIMAVRQLPRREAVPILKMALKDRSDDVRLFAYSMMDRFEGEINAEIDRVRQQMKRDGSRPRSHGRLAALYWELAYLGLAQGGVRDHVLQQSLNHVEQRLAMRDDAAARLLLGRVLVELGEYERAEQAMEQAVRAGLDHREIAPYRAEIAFRQRRFDAIPGLLAQVQDRGRREPALAQVVALWCGVPR